MCMGGGGGGGGGGGVRKISVPKSHKKSFSFWILDSVD